MSIIAFGIDMLMAAIFFGAVFGKISSGIYNFRLSIMSYQIVPKRLLTLTALFVLTIELFIAFAYLSGHFLIETGIFTAAMFLGFTVLLLRKKYLSNDKKSTCSCFGKIEWMNKYPMARNISFIMVAALRMFMPERRIQSLDNLWWSLFVLLLIMSIAVGLNLRSTIKRGKELQSA